MKEKLASVRVDGDRIVTPAGVLWTLRALANKSGFSQNEIMEMVFRRMVRPVIGDGRNMLFSTDELRRFLRMCKASQNAAELL